MNVWPGMVNLVHAADKIPLNTNYRVVVAKLQEVAERAAPLGYATMAVDNTGIGRAITDYLRVTGIPMRTVTLTGSDRQHPPGDRH
jgi:hypothetical protein